MRTKWILTLIIWGGLAIVGVAASYLFALNLWAVLGIIAVTTIVNSVWAEIEDRLPGGFYNPRVKSKPPEK